MADEQEVKVAQEEGTPPSPPEQVEYDKTWEAMDKEEAGEKKEADQDRLGDGLPPKEEARQEGADKQVGDEDPDKDKDHGGTESVLKALKDTKAFATRLAEDKKELEKKVKALEEGRGSVEEVALAEAKVQKAGGKLDEIKSKVYEDYPELQDLLDPLIESNQTLTKKVAEFESKKQADTETELKTKALDHFNTKIKPRIVEKHADFEAVMKDGDYWNWAETQRPALQFAAMDSGDPEDIVWALNEYKRHKASGKVVDLKSQEEKQKQTKTTFAQSLLRGGGTPPPFGNKKANQGDYDSGWDEAGQALKKEGVGR